MGALSTPELSSVPSNVTAAGASGNNGCRPAAEASPARQSPQVRLQPLGADQAQQILAGGSGCGSAPGPASAGGSGTPNSLRFRAHTKHVKTVAPSLQALDFISIAVNSVGGGGVPRPYGKFQACRSGDGNATWERLPPPSGSWQARALPIAVTLLGDSPPSAGPVRRAESSCSRTTSRPEGCNSPLGSAAASPRRHTHAALSDGAGHVSRVGGDTTRLRLSFSPPSTGGLNFGDGSGFAHGRSRSQPSPGGGSSPRGAARAREPTRHPPGAAGAGHAAAAIGPGSLLEQSGYYRRPGSSLHRSLVPLPPPEPHNLGAWFALPAATFLADVPNIPEHLRMDNGYSVSREFLMSGLNPPRRPPPAASPPLSPTPAHAQFLASYPQQQQQQQQQPPLQPQVPVPTQQSAPGQPMSLAQPLLPQRTGDSLNGLHAHHSQQQQRSLELRPEESLALWSALEGATSVTSAQQQQHGGGGGGGGGSAPGRLRGVYVPLEKRVQEPTPAAVVAAAAAAEAAAAEAAAAASLAAAGPSGGVMAVRGALHLPPETSLPRRAEPAGW